MGDGSRLKEILDEKKITVAQLARETKINPQTLYTIIKRDAAIRFDFALRISNVIGVETSEICSDSNFIEENDSETDAFPPLPSGLDGLLDDKRVKRYMNNTLYPLMNLFGKKAMPEVDQLLTYYYQLTDEGRDEVKKYVQERYMLKKDSERAEQVKQIKKW